MGLKCDLQCTFADIAVVWAKDEEGIIRGLIVERVWKDSPPETHGKWSLRASATGEPFSITSGVPKENIFPNVKD